MSQRAWKLARIENSSRVAVVGAAVLVAMLVVACHSPDEGTGGGTKVVCPVPDSSHLKSMRSGGDMKNMRAGANAGSGTDASAQAREASLQFSGRSTVMKSHIPAAVRKFSDLGEFAQTANLSVTVALALNHEDELDQELRDIYTPGSPKYHHFLTPEQFRARYAPTADQVASVQNFFSERGVSAMVVDDNGYLIRAEGSTRSLNSIFHTEVHHYLDRSGNVYFAPSRELQIPAGLPIRAVHGLQSVTHWTRHAFRANSSSAHAGNGPRGGMTPEDIRKAYDIPSSVDGSGETMALFELDGYVASDIRSYEQTFGLPEVPLSTVLVNGATGGVGLGMDEVTLDIELMIALAPGASRILVYEGTNDEQGVLKTYSKIASDNLAREVSTSWGAPEAQSTTSFIQTENMIFKQMAAQGQTIYAAAGDAGAYDDGVTLSVDDPASQPYVIGVGGTRLYTTANGAYDHEVTWNRDNRPADGGGGGGISTIWSRPSWQVGAASNANQGSTTMRNVPDVALNSDPQSGYAIFVGSGWEVFGGTSCAAPLWAAFTALVNQQRADRQMDPLGFASPLFYKIGLSTRYTSDFWDIHDGSTNMFYPAVEGFDNATGWGSFKGQSLFEDLTDGSLELAAAPSTGC
jgi:kumamolisin